MTDQKYVIQKGDSWLAASGKFVKASRLAMKFNTAKAAVEYGNRVVGSEWEVVPASHYTDVDEKEAVPTVIIWAGKDDIYNCLSRRGKYYWGDAPKAIVYRNHHEASEAIRRGELFALGTPMVIPIPYEVIAAKETLIATRGRMLDVREYLDTIRYLVGRDIIVRCGDNEYVGKLEVVTVNDKWSVSQKNGEIWQRITFGVNDIDGFDNDGQWNIIYVKESK